MRAVSVLTTVGLSGFAHKDLAAIKTGAPANGFFFEGAPVTPGFDAICQASHVLDVLIRLENGAVAMGDCLDVIFAGAAGRAPLFRPEDHLAAFEAHVAPALRAMDMRDFRRNAEAVDGFEIDGQPLHMAVRYGVTQALLHAAALAKGVTMAEIVADAYGSRLEPRVVPILVSIPKTDPFILDRMIMKRAELLPHASFTVVETDLGADGRLILDYAAKVSQRVQDVGAPDYRPVIHLDTYGTIGEMLDCDIDRMADFIGRLAQAAAPCPLYIESPVIADTQAKQIEIYAALRAAIRERKVPVRLIVDEWCNTLDDIKLFDRAGAADFVQIKAPDLGGINNTIEAVLYCRDAGIGCCLGGTANDTDHSSRIATHIAQACGADFLLGRPGLGGDAALMIMRNEMLRTIALAG